MAEAAKIDKKIVGYKVFTGEQPVVEPVVGHDVMHEGMKRPEMLVGATYKIKTPDSDHALYITINDVILNEGTEHEERRPYEIFINSKNMEQYQWVVALTRVMSAVFRKGGNVDFLADELKSVFDPKGGYFGKGGVFMPSLVANIGHVLHRHLVGIGMIKPQDMPSHVKEFIDSKANAIEAGDGQYPASATMCSSCHTKAVVLMDSCQVCLACGASKCG